MLRLLDPASKNSRLCDGISRRNFLAIGALGAAGVCGGVGLSLPELLAAESQSGVRGSVKSVILVYLIMVVNFQSWSMPLAAISALPLAIGGAVFGLLATATAISVPALMGAIMVIGVSTANSVLVVSFARDRLHEGAHAAAAAMDAVRTRFRPVLMTATAMIVGMIPMAIGGAGEEQNAALARAVIGGLLFATPTTLLIVPYLFAVLRKGNDGKPEQGVFEEGSLA